MTVAQSILGWHKDALFHQDILLKTLLLNYLRYVYKSDIYSYFSVAIFYWD